nr:hypothetical protein [Tanacetum cinerariifolium]
MKSSKDASVETVMNILCLEGLLAEKLGLNELQPNVDQLMVPIHHLPDQVIVGATALSLALDVSSTKGTSNTAAVTTDTTMVLSTTFASASTIAPIFVDDYEVMGADDQAVAIENAASFLTVDDVRGSCFLSRSLNLYAPFLSASVTSYGPSHLEPSFPVSSAWLASLLRYTSVGMPISAGMIASIPYVNENGVSPLPDFIMAIGLRMFDRSKVLADAWFLAPIFEWIIPELFSIIRDNFSRESKSTDNVVPYKFFDLIASDGCYWFCFNPLCEVVNGYYQEFDFSRSFQKRSGYVNSLFIERPLRRDWS